MIFWRDFDVENLHGCKVLLVVVNVGSMRWVSAAIYCLCTIDI